MSLHVLLTSEILTNSSGNLHVVCFDGHILLVCWQSSANISHWEIPQERAHVCFHHLFLGILHQHSPTSRCVGLDLCLLDLCVEGDQAGAPHGRKGPAGREDQEVVRGEEPRERRGEGCQGAHQKANCHGELIMVSPHSR